MIFQVFNSRIQKHGSFEDFMIELAKVTQMKGINLGFVFPEIKTEEVKEELESLGAKIYVIKNRWSSLKFVKEILRIVLKEKPQAEDGRRDIKNL